MGLGFTIDFFISSRKIVIFSVSRHFLNMLFSLHFLNFFLFSRAKLPGTEFYHFNLVNCQSNKFLLKQSVLSKLQSNKLLLLIVFRSVISSPQYHHRQVGPCPTFLEFDPPPC
mmetsp:Transcript_7930/g.14540  ORF Transcript_7930/g.14540 Transcript_7930/m.14540 type:complete len:113 (+) Transcript_7930:2011-2349(+)